MGQKTAVVVDEEVQNILNKAYKNTTAILKKNIKTLRQVAKELMEKETIDGKWVAAAFKKASNCLTSSLPATIYLFFPNSLALGGGF